MAVKKTFQVGSNSIRSKAKEVVKVDKKTREIIKNLIDTMRHENLVGMAAPQIGKSVRIFVSEIRKTTIRKNLKKDKLRIFVNPLIVFKSKQKTSDYEGCGSVGSKDLFGIVKRSKNISIKALDEKGNKFELNASGLLSRIIQHEMDHLNGTVFLDRVDNMRNLLGREEYIKFRNKK